MAFDQDSLNATLIYEIISGNERKLFRINPNNGIMYLQKEVDLEEESLPGNTFVLQVEARQRENPLRKAVARHDKFNVVLSLLIQFLIFPFS